MNTFESPDKYHLQAAVGWLELGNWTEANEELERIASVMRAHPDVLQVRCKIYCDAQKWDYAAEIADALCRLLPESAFGPLHLAHALRKQNRTSDARHALLPVADKFPDEWRISYQLACYYCQLGELKAAMEWLERAIDVAGKVDIRAKALDEPDFEALWPDISEI